MWALFASYLPTVPGYVCLNNLTHIFGPLRTVKKTFARLKIHHLISASPYDDRAPLWSTGGPMKVKVRWSGRESVDVYAWTTSPGSASIPSRQHLLLLWPDELQRFALMTRHDLADRMVKMTNEAVNYRLEDVLRLACEVSGIGDGGEWETL